jgi:hypothetical protein
MARYKPQTGKIKSLEEANLALKEIGMLEHEIAAIDAEGDSGLRTSRRKPPGREAH